MEWMLDIQLGRRNLSPIQRIAIAEKYRPIYEKQAKENQGKRNDLSDNIPQNIGESEKKKLSKDREVNSRLAKVANVNPETYRQAKRVLDSDNEDLKQRVLSGETAISTGYKELIGKKENKKVEDTNITTSTTQSTTMPSMPQKTQVSDEVRQICEDLKYRVLGVKDFHRANKVFALRTPYSLSFGLLYTTKSPTSTLR